MYVQESAINIFVSKLIVFKISALIRFFKISTYISFFFSKILPNI